MSVGRIIPISSGEPQDRRWIAFGIVVFALVLFGLNLSGLPNFTDNEWRLSSYVLDVLHNGHWFVQTDMQGDVASKPPLLTWLVTLAVLPTGGITRFALYWPSAFATIVVSLVILRVGTQMFGWRAGYLGSFTYLLSYAAFTQMAMPRYDGLLTLPVTLGAIVAFHAWQTGRGWTLFWAIAACGTMVKGPLALLLSASGLFAAYWEPKPSLPNRSRQWPGILIFLSVIGSWFALAYWQMGDPLIDKMIRRELIGHAVHGYADGRNIITLLEPTWNFLRSYAPWSLFAAIAFWRVVKQPAEEPRERAFERFLFVWFFFGLVIFTIASHQRGRLILPLLPAAALLAGREMSHQISFIARDRLFRLSIGLAVVVLGGAALYSHVLLKRSRGVQQTLAAAELIRKLHSSRDKEAKFPFTYLENVAPLQIYAGTRNSNAPRNEVDKLLAGSIPVFIVTKSSSLSLTNSNGEQLWELFRWPDHGESKIRIISNHPRLEWTERSAQWLEGMRVEVKNACLIHGNMQKLVFESQGGDGEVTIINETKIPATIAIHILRSGDDLVYNRKISPGIPTLVSWQ